MTYKILLIYSNIIIVCIYTDRIYNTLIIVNTRLLAAAGTHSHVHEYDSKKKKKCEELVSSVSDCLWQCSDTKCNGWVIHDICIIGSGDLHRLKYEVNVDNLQGPFFHNKYFMERDHTVMDCLEELIVDRNRQEYSRECGNTLDTPSTLTNTKKRQQNRTLKSRS